MPRWLWKKPVDNEVAEETEFHLEMRTQEYIARGLDPAAARDAALRRFGDLEHVRAACREIGRRRDTEMRRREILGELRQDVTFAVRQLAANPGFTFIAVLTLALGIGATTAIFSAVHAVVLRPLPVPRPQRLMAIVSAWQDQPSGLSAGSFTEMADLQRSFSDMTAIQLASFNLADGGTPERTIGARVTASYFRVFGVPPERGRVFGASDQPGRERVVVLSHRLWARRFGADPAVLGRDVRMNGQPYTVVGIMPARFDFTSDSEELWVPIAFTPERKANYDENYLRVVARLRDGVTRQQAGQDLATLAAGLRQRHPRENRERTFQVQPFMERLIGDSSTRLMVLLGAVGLVLLIACGNVANLLLARGAVRAHELAIRSSLGAGQGRIVRQLLTESAVLALVSAVVGLAFAWWGVRALVALSPPGVPRLDQTTLDGTVLAFTLGLSIASSVVFGLAPALRAGRASGAALKEGGRGAAGAGRDWLRPALITLEVALAVLLLVGAGLLIRSAVALQRVQPGFDPRGVLSARIMLPAVEYQEPERVIATFDRLLAETAQLAGVRSAALSNQVPLSPGGGNNGLIAEGKPDSSEFSVSSQLRVVTPGYFQAIGIPIVRGRGFDAGDRRGRQKVMVISQTLAEALFPGQDPIGKRVSCCERGPGHSRDFKVVVGVAGNTRWLGLAAGIEPEFYLPVAQAPAVVWDWTQRSMYVVARTDGSPESLTPSLRRIVAGIDPDLPLYEIKTMEERIVSSLSTARFNTLLLTLLGAIGLILSAVGIYGVIAYFVTQRTSEIGVRMALGATRRDVTRLVLRQAAGPVAAGVLLGLAASAVATRVLAANLVGVERMDPVTLAAVVAVLAGAAFLASVFPARRAASVDPKEALQGA
jgi:predicted permease